MTLTSDKIADLRVKRLEMVQLIIARLGNYGTSLKNYCITLTTGVCGFAITSQKPAIILLSVISTSIFLLLDAQFLRVERRFRLLFEQMALEKWDDVPNFSLDRSSISNPLYQKALISWSIMIFYIPILGIIVITFLISFVLYGHVM